MEEAGFYAVLKEVGVPVFTAFLSVVLPLTFSQKRVRQVKTIILKEIGSKLIKDGIFEVYADIFSFTMTFTFIGTSVSSLVYAWFLLKSFKMGKTFVSIAILQGCLHIFFSLFFSFILFNGVNVALKLGEKLTKNRKLSEYNAYLSYIFNGIVAGSSLSAMYYSLLAVFHLGFGYNYLGVFVVALLVFIFLVFAVRSELESVFAQKVNEALHNRKIYATIVCDSNKKITGKLIFVSSEYLKLIHKKRKECIIPMENVKIVELKFLREF